MVLYQGGRGHREGTGTEGKLLNILHLYAHLWNHVNIIINLIIKIKLSLKNKPLKILKKNKTNALNYVF